MQKMEPTKKVKTSCMNERCKVCSDGQGSIVLWVHGYMAPGKLLYLRLSMQRHKHPGRKLAILT